MWFINVATSLLAGSCFLAVTAPPVSAAGTAEAASAALGFCEVETYYQGNDICIMTPTTPTLHVFCQAYGGATASVSIVQSLFTNNQTCPSYGRSIEVFVVPGIDVRLNLRQSSSFGSAYGYAESVL